MLNSAIDQIFLTKVVKMHHSDKPWMTPALKKLITNTESFPFWQQGNLASLQIEGPKRTYC